MRIGFLFLPLALCAPPALAQSAPQQSKALQLPADTADRIADAMQSISRAVRDLAARDDPVGDRKVAQQIAEARPKIEQSVKVVNEALPKVTADLQRAQRALERAIANMPDPNYPRR